MARTYHITTFGCQMNTYDSELMEGILLARGLERAGSETDADVVLFNTCVVREGAETRAVGRINQLRTLKQQRPEMIIGVTGCMAQKEGERLQELLPHVDLIMGTRAIPRLSPLIDSVEATGQPQICTEILDESYPADVIPVRQRPLKALVNIIFGCNKNCSYCIVPRTRGREVSRSVVEIVDEVRNLIEHGYKEITLVGQNVNSYRPDRETNFGDLLRAVDAVCAPAGVWVRYITSHPRDCNAAHISAVAEGPAVCENFHMPMQAGSSKVLRAMRRGYTRERYLELIDQIRASVPTATLTTDIIVGFPGESEEEYQETLDLVRRVRFDSAFMYMYSPRPGTPAAEEFEDHIPIEVKKARLAQLIEIQEQISLEVNRETVGQTLDVLVEDPAPRTPGDLLARTRGDKMVIFHGDPALIGQCVRVKIHEANAHTLKGERVD